MKGLADGTGMDVAALGKREQGRFPRCCYAITLVTITPQPAGHVGAEGNPTSLAKLGFTNAQNIACKVNIANTKPRDFADA
jgi:hypothetical protein